MIPKKNRQDRLIQLLDKETREMDELKAQLKAINYAIDVKTDAIEEEAVVEEESTASSLAQIVAEAMPSDEAAVEPEPQPVVEEAVTVVEEPVAVVEEPRVTGIGGLFFKVQVGGTHAGSPNIIVSCVGSSGSR